MRKLSLFFLLLILSSGLFVNAQKTELETETILEIKLTNILKAQLNRTSGELTISKWDEVSFSISLFEKPLSSRTEGEKEILEYPDFEARVYTIAEGIEFDIVLDSIPENNVFTFQIVSEGVQFFYQAPLNEEVLEKGLIVNATHAIDETGRVIYYREPKIVGSYAVYGFKQNNEYGSGKVGHYIRPVAYDSKGDSIFCDLLIENGILTITAPKAWLDSAVYPVIIDPTFGKSDIGGSVQQFPTDTVGTTRANLTDSDINIFQFNIYAITSFGIPTDTKTGIYNSSAFLPYGLLGTSVTTVIDPLAWYSFAADINVSTPGDYYLAWNTDDANIHVRYDSIPQNTTYMRPAFGDGGLSFPDPFGAHGNNFTSQLSLFVNYTVTGAVTYFLDAENLTLSTLLAGENVTVSMDLETNSTPAFYWFGHDSSGAMENTTARAWTANGTISDWFWLSPQIGFPFTVTGYVNTTDNFNSTTASFSTVRDTVNLITEGLWIFLIIWIFATIFGFAKKDPVVRMISSMIGIAYGILYLRTSFVLALGLILLNLYLLYDAIVS